MQTFTLILSAVILIFTLIPLIRHESWVFRIFDYPRLQKFVATVLCIMLLFLNFYASEDHKATLIFLVLMILNAAFLFYQILPFTFLGKMQVVRITKEIQNQGISIMISNVLQDNTNYKGCLTEIKKANPDIVLLLETNYKWDSETNSLVDDFEFKVKVPLENKYGLLFYSKLKIESYEVKYLVEENIPSVHAVVVLKNGQRIRIFSVHPTPPVPGENPRSTERDKELLLVAELAKASDLPVIVIGDLNDVAWSYTTELFLKMSGLLDPRRGRGFFNSFNAHNWFMRFPLDHAFISTDIKLKSIRRLDNFNSDHFPIFISLQYEETAKFQQDEMQPDAEDVAVAEKKKASV